MAFSTVEFDRYSRHLSLGGFGVAGQEKLHGARVLIIGCGGLGSPAGLYLAAAGIGTLGLVDCDRVELSNLQRQVLYDTDSVAQPKATSARDRLHALNPHIRVVAHQLELAAANIAEVFGGYDVIIDGSDRIATRYLVNDACVLLGKALISAAIHRFEGQAMTYVPGRGPCYRCLFPEADATVPGCAETGVLGVLPGVLGVLQATEAIKLLAGIGEPLIGRLLTYDALAMRFREFGFRRRPDCAVCGEQPTIVSLQDPGAFCSAEELRRVRRISAVELQGLLQRTDPAAPALIDVREAAEFRAGHLDGARNLPLGEFEARLAELPRDQPLVFICRSGARSLRACALAARSGIGEPLQLEGGLLAWAQIIDSRLEVAPAA